jgi:hypothetical protein
MKTISFTAKINAYQTFDIQVTDEQYNKLKEHDFISGESLANYIEDNLIQDVEWGEIEAEGLESVSIYDIK